MFTSFRNDPARIKKEMEISTYSGRYALDVPGPGLDLPFMEDTQVRMQYWGANLKTCRVDLEGELFSINRKISRDYNDQDEYKKFIVDLSTVFPNDSFQVLCIQKPGGNSLILQQKDFS